MLKVKILSESVKCLFSKLSDNKEDLWLPLVKHMEDSASIATMLWDTQLSGNTRQLVANSLGVPKEVAKQFFIFLSAVHDIGKAIPVYQAKLLTGNYKPVSDVLISAGLFTNFPPVFTFPNATPHTLAGQVLLESFGCHKNIASIIGAHHGKPVDAMDLLKGGQDSCDFNYHLTRSQNDVWTSLQKEVLGYALYLSGFADLAAVPIPDMRVQVIGCGFIKNMNRIVNNQELFPFEYIEEVA